MPRTRKRRKVTKTKKQTAAVRNEGRKSPTPPFTIFTTTTPTAEPHKRQPKKMDVTANTTEKAKEVNSIEDDIKFDVYKMQEQWLMDKQEKGNVSMAASTSLLMPVTCITETPITTISQNNSLLECKEINSEYATIKRDSSITSISKEKGKIYIEVNAKRDNSLNGNEINKENENMSNDATAIVMPAKYKMCESNQNSNYYFDADEVDMQETDTDEEGYTDIDFDEEYELIECDEDTEMYTSHWSENPTQTNEEAMLHFIKSDSAPLQGLPTHNLPIFYFYKLLGGPQFFQSLSESCNKRALKVTKGSITSTDNVHSETFIAIEMSIFFGICLQMGSMQFTTLAEYWECLAYHRLKGFSNKLSYERFKSILEVLNFENFQSNNGDANGDDDGDKFVDLKPLLYFFNSRMESIYNCDQNLVLNDPMMYWKGRLNWVNDLRKKFRRNAVLIHLLTEPPAGVVLKICLDMESVERKLIAPNSKEHTMQRLSIAIELLKEKLRKGHTVFVSEYYSSCALCLELYKFDTYSSGLLDQTRFGNCKEVVLKQLTQPKEFQTSYSDSIMMGKSRYRNKSFYFYTSNPAAVCTNKFNQHNCLKLLNEINSQLRNPAEVLEHNMLSYQLALERTEIKWDKRLMIFIMNLILHNSFLLYKKHAINKSNLISYEKFRQEIITSLLNKKFDWTKAECEMEIVEEVITKDHAHNSRSFAKTILEEKLQLLNAHQPKKVPMFEGKCVKKRCRICDKGGIVSFSMVCCRICPDMPGLCETPCFKIWHDRMRKKIIEGRDK